MGERLRTWRWTRKRIAELDPEVDYAEIMRLSSLYGLNDLQMHWFYTVGTPAAGIAPAVIDAVYREGTGKYTTDALKRKDDSNDHLLTWLEHGPDTAAAQKSVAMVNKYHAHFAKTYPDGFADPVDYVYILCLNATLVHTVTRSLGLPGLSDKEKRAAYRFWVGISAQFTMPDGRSVTELTAFPEDFDGMEEYVRTYQARPWPVHQRGHVSTTGVVNVFAATWFPRPLRFFGRALITTFFTPELRRAHAIQAPPVALQWVARGVMRVIMAVSTYVLPDPWHSFPDQRRKVAAEGRGTPSAVDTAVHRAIAGSRNGAAASTLGCPHLAALQTTN